MSKAVAKTNDAEVAPARELSPAVQAIVGRARATGRYNEVNPFLAQALEADTLEGATAVGAVLPARDNVLGERLRLVDVTFIDSDPELESSLPFFAVIDCFREMTGERVKVSIGAEQVLGVLIRACEMDWFPFDAELDSIKLGAGRTAINLRLAPQRVDTIGDSL